MSNPWSWWLALPVLVVGCGKGDEKTAPPGEPAPVTANQGTQGGLAIEIDGRARPGSGGFIKRLPDGSLQAYVGDGGSCEELMTNVFDGKREHVLLDIATRLAPDGTETKQAVRVHIRAGNDAEPEAAAPVTLSAEPDRGARIDLELAFAGKGDGGEKVTVSGKGSLEGCGDPDTSKGPAIPKEPLVSNATMTIAGKKFPIRGALRKGEDIVLSDFPRDCTAAWFIGAALERERGSWVLGGARFAEKVRGEGKGLAVAAGKTGTSANGPTVELQLSGSDKLADYPVAIEGTVQALDCK